MLQQQNGGLSVRIIVFIVLMSGFSVSSLDGQHLTFSENFDDTEVLNRDLWQGDSDHFTIHQTPGGSFLRLDAPEGGRSELYTESAVSFGYWEFFIRQDFAPSNNNRAFIFLMADQAGFSGEVNGYAVRTGANSSPNYFRLFRFTGGEAEEILRGNLDISEGGAYRVRVTRDSDGRWQLFESEGSNSDPVFASEAVDNVHRESSRFGFRFDYTATRTAHTWLDDIRIFNSESFGIRNLQPDRSGEITLTFNYPLDERSVRPENIVLYPGGNTPFRAEKESGHSVRFDFAEKLNPGEYQLDIRSVANRFGDYIEERTVPFRIFTDVKPGEVVINEILYRETAGSYPQFVEIFNRLESAVNLSGWYLRTDSGPVIIPDGTMMDAGEFLVLSGEEALPGGIRLQGWPGLSGSGGEVILKDVSGEVMDSVIYSGESDPGVSLERKDPAAISDDPFNWAASRSDTGATPGITNSRFQPDVRAPEMVFANRFHPDSVEVVFNQFVQPDAGTADNLSPLFAINEAEVNVISYDPGEGNRIVLDGSGLDKRTPAKLTVHGISDFQGNRTEKAEIEIAQPLEPGDLVINEIMYHPIADNRDGLPDQSEYIELYNRMLFAVSLDGIVLHDEPDDHGEVRVMAPDETRGKWIPSNGYALIYPEPEPLPVSESRTGIMFGLNDFSDSAALRISRQSLGLTNSGRTVVLADSMMREVDRVDYRPEWHNPNLFSTHGISLERISPELDSNDASNWGSSTSVYGGTPGAENTLFQYPERADNASEVSLSPNPFSPDGDGHEDRLFIHYEFDDPDYLLRIRIFDRYGRLVRNLADGLPAGYSGSAIWDGLMDDGSRNRIGIYIVLVEAYNSSNGSRKAFREIAVLARQF